MEPGNRTVIIDVGGERIIKVSTDLFSVAGDNKFSSLFSGRWEKQLDADGKLFVDYSPQVFLPLIEFYAYFEIQSLRCWRQWWWILIIAAPGS